jgi:hypothetical protein
VKRLDLGQRVFNNIAQGQKSNHRPLRLSRAPHSTYYTNLIPHLKRQKTDFAHSLLRADHLNRSGVVKAKSIMGPPISHPCPLHIAQFLHYHTAVLQAFFFHLPFRALFASAGTDALHPFSVSTSF